LFDPDQSSHFGIGVNDSYTAHLNRWWFSVQLLVQSRLQARRSEFGLPQAACVQVGFKSTYLRAVREDHHFDFVLQQ
jgi:hypothetical protein